jgi:hypothetical protein
MFNFSKPKNFLIFITLFFIPIGCTKTLEIVPVSGHLTLDGKPVSDCVVRFSLVHQPEGLENTPSFGKTDAEGYFVLKTMERPERNGCPVGECVVLILYNPDPPIGVSPEDYIDSQEYLAMKPKLPSEADDGTLRFTIPQKGTKNVQINLVSQP